MLFFKQLIDIFFNSRRFCILNKRYLIKIEHIYFKLNKILNNLTILCLYIFVKEQQNREFVFLTELCFAWVCFLKVLSGQPNENVYAHIVILKV